MEQVIGWSENQERVQKEKRGQVPGRRRLEVGGGECGHFCDTIIDRLKEVKIKRRAKVFVEPRGEASVKAVYLLY